MPNITADGKFTGSHNEFRESPTVLSFSALNIFLSITATLGNVMILIALQKVSSIYPSTKRFFRCLTVTDLGVGLIVQPFYATFLLSRITLVSKNVVNALSCILCAVSLLTSTAISVDRLLALVLGLRYRHVVTLIKASSCSLFFANCYFPRIVPMVEEGYDLRVSLYNLDSLSINIDFLSHEDSPQTTISCPSPTRTRERRRDSAQDSKVQKDSF